MWKAVLAGTTALAIAGTSIVYAQQRHGRGQEGGRRGPATVEDMRAFGDARLAALKAGLALTAEQEKNWPAFEQAAKELAKLRADRMTAMRARITAQREARRNRDQKKGGGDQTQPQTQQTTPDPIERLRQRGTAMAETGAALKKLADATDPLYKSLDDKQKRRFAVLGRIGGGRDGRPGFRGRDGEGRGMHRGNRRSELAPGQDHESQSGSERRGPRREGFERGQRRGADRGTENL